MTGEEKEKEAVKKTVKKTKKTFTDTGSPEAQVTLLSKKIEEFFVHLKKNPKDLHSKRGLLGMVNKRRKLLSYLKKESEERYEKLIKKLGLKK